MTRVLPIRRATVVAVTVAALASACSSSSTSSPTTQPAGPTSTSAPTQSSSTTGAVGTSAPAGGVLTDEVTGLSILLDDAGTVEGWSADATGDCTVRSASLRGGAILVETWSTSCGSTDALNGRHGTYSGLDDAKVPKDATAVTLPAGEARTFTQEYDEYTNSRNEYHEPVVLIRMAASADPGYQMAMVIGVKGDVDQAATLAVAKNLRTGTEAPSSPTTTASGATTSTNGGSTTAGVHATGSLAPLLALVPTSEADGKALITAGDITKIRTWPRAKSGHDDVANLIHATDTGLSFSGALRPAISRDDLAELIGFDTRDVDAWIDYGTPPATVSVLVGHFDAAAIAAAMGGWSDGAQLDRQEKAGWTLLSVGEEGKVDIKARNPLRQLGQAVRLAVRSDVVVWTRTDATRDATVAAIDGGPSLADEATFTALAGQLDQHSAVEMMVVTKPWETAGWDVGAFGDTMHPDGTTFIAALHLPSADAAAAAVTKLRSNVESGTSLASKQPWSKRVGITSITSDGEVAVEVLTYAKAGRLVGILMAQDNLFDVG